MTVTMALAGDTMLGRGVAERLLDDPDHPLVSTELAAVLGEADLFVLNLECCISERGEPWPDPGKPFFFRAPPHAAERLAALGVDAVTLANNHALDYGAEALLDTLDHLDRVGIACVGAGADRDRAREPAVLEARGQRLGLLGLTDHPPDFAAGVDSPGTAYADLRAGVPEWVTSTSKNLETDGVIVTPHWGPNMVGAPVRHVRQAASGLLSASASVVAGHSAHVFHGVSRRPDQVVCYDLGDFVDDYAVHPELRNDRGLVWFVELDGGTPVGLEAVPVALDYAHTRLADESEFAFVRDRFAEACAEFDTPVDERGGRLVVDLRR